MIIIRWALAVLLCAAMLPAAHAQGGVLRIEPLPGAAGPATSQNAGLFAEKDFTANPSSPSVVGNGVWRVQPAPRIE